MKQKSFLHHYKGFGIHESDCMVHIIEDDGEYTIIFEDIDSGTSVTNSSEQLATEIIQEYKLDHENCKFYETYRQYDYECFDEIEYTWKDGKAYNPIWTPGSEEMKKLFCINK